MSQYDILGNKRHVWQLMTHMSMVEEDKVEQQVIRMTA